MHIEYNIWSGGSSSGYTTQTLNKVNHAFVLAGIVVGIDNDVAVVVVVLVVAVVLVDVVAVELLVVALDNAVVVYFSFSLIHNYLF